MRTGITARVLSSRLKDLTEQGFVQSLEGARGGYEISERGRSLEPIVASIARWFALYGIDETLKAIEESLTGGRGPAG